jgi:DNA mismatch repair protein MutL
MTIQILSEVVAAQIAAGEVVERPASVVKELIENALDAGAHVIRVEVEAGGRRLIRITDDGQGIPGDEAELAFTRHATSKLRTIDDLDTIQTLGFRGEALASVASVAKVTLLTRTADAPTGTLIRMEGGRIVDHRSAGTPVGTTITVEQLFYNTPARLKFLKAETTERRHIDAVVTRMAMAYPNVRFSLMQDGRLTFSTSGTGDLADVLVEVLGVETMRAMLPVSPVEPSRPDLPPITVYGYTSAPHHNRNTRSHITLFVNGRHIQDASLSHAVCQAYHTLMHSDRYPISVLMINMPPEDVDVNVHPAKAEVRFRSPDAIFSAVQRAVRQAVVAQAPVPTISVRTFNDDEREPDDDMSSPYPGVPAAVATRVSSESQLDFDLPVYDPGRRSQQIAPSYQLPELPLSSSGRADYSPPVTVQASADLMQRPRTLPPLRVVGQIGAMYIVAEGPAGMYLVDQHAAHERILYEQYMLERTNRPVIAQQTLDAVAVELSSAAAHLIEENLEALNTIGFAIEPFGTDTFLIRAVPAIFANHLPQEAIGVILDDLEIGAEPGEATLEAQIVLRICKVAAIRAGQTLSYDEMQTLLRQLERCTSPRTCPHGRPTMIHMTAEQLAKEFGRT